MPILEVTDGPGAGQCYRLDQEAFIGRSLDDAPSAHQLISLQETAVSRRHARILRRDHGYLIEDLHSTNGTFLQGQPIEPGSLYPLREGDQIRICSTHLVFRAQSNDVVGAGAGGPRRSPLRLEQHTVLPGAASIVLTDDSARTPEMSMVLDASRVMAVAQGRLQETDTPTEEVLLRLRAMAQVSIALGAETDRDRLMGKIMDCIFDVFPKAERSLLLLSDGENADELVPVVARTRHALVEHEVALSRTIVSEVIEKKHSILSVDAFSDERFDTKESIAHLGIRAVMCAPLLIADQVLGLIQVDTATGSHSFSKEDLHILTGISTQVAIALKNSQLYAEIENLFHGFVTASVHAIEARDPSTAGHSFRVAEYTERLARVVDSCEERELRNTRFSPDQMREIRYAALLHDFGKVGVRERVLTKPNKLFPHQLASLEQRFQYARSSLQRQAYVRLLDLHEQHDFSIDAFRRQRRKMQWELDEELHRLEGFLAMIRQANEPTVAHAQVPRELAAALDCVFPDENGDIIPVLSGFEFDSLCLSQGSLTPEERLEIESHVSTTYTFLSLIPWTKTLSGVADIAHAHHEKLDGSGYPRGLTADEIPVQSKIMTVADIYDALTSGDRPYKQALPPDQALDILAAEAKQNKIDRKLFELFVESKAYYLVEVE